MDGDVEVDIDPTDAENDATAFENGSSILGGSSLSGAQLDFSSGSTPLRRSRDPSFDADVRVTTNLVHFCRRSHSGAPQDFTAKTTHTRTHTHTNTHGTAWFHFQRSITALRNESVNHGNYAPRRGGCQPWYLMPYIATPPNKKKGFPSSQRDFFFFLKNTRYRRAPLFLSTCTYI